MDLNTGEHMWRTPIGDGPTNHPALKELDLGPLGGFAAGMPLLTKSLLFVFTGQGIIPIPGMGGDGVNLRALDKVSGEVVYEMSLGANSVAVPMTYAVDGKQYIGVAAVTDGVSEIIVLSLP